VRIEKFINTIHSQIRPPLSAIKGYSSLILEKDYGPIKPELADVFRGMYRSANGLVDSIDDYIDLFSITTGSMHYDHEEIDVKDILNYVIHKFQQDPLNVNLELKESVPSIYLINGDPKQIKGVFKRLIDNAIRYSSKEKVTVSLSRDEKNIFVSIEDNGIGIAKEDIQNLFNEFYRAPNARQISAAGTGIGLYITKKIVEAHNGHVWAESDGISKGAKFFVELPVNYSN
jgi:signal transduction histidine kinase